VVCEKAVTNLASKQNTPVYLNLGKTSRAENRGPKIPEGCTRYLFIHTGRRKAEKKDKKATFRVELVRRL